MTARFVPCATCGTPCASTKQVPECNECQGRRLAGAFWSPDVLTDGRWVNVAGVMRWQPTPTTPQPAPPKPVVRQPAECGTDGGYYRHLRITKTPTCGPCREAHASVERERYERVRSAA